MPNKAEVSVTLAPSYDTRGNLAATNMAAGKDQRRLNVTYQITRPSVGAPPDVISTKRPGVTDKGDTFGASTQTIYLVTSDPTRRWDDIPWVVVRDGTACKLIVCSNGNSHTFSTLTSDFYPRFVQTIRLNVGGVSTDLCLLQFQNVTSPNGPDAIKSFYSSTFNGWTEITDTDYTGLFHVGGIEQLDGFLIQGDARGRLYQSEVNSAGSWITTDFLTRTIAQDPAQGIMKARNQIVFAGLGTLEVFTNQGAPEGSVVQRIPFSTQHIGLADVAGGGAGMSGKTHYYTAIGDLIFFLGRFGQGARDTCLIAYDGRKFEKVSRPHEDQILSSTTNYSVNKVMLFGHVGVGVQQSAPDSDTQRMYVFFPELNDWFEWEATVWGPVNNGVYFAGATNSQKVYHFAQSENWQDAGTNYSMINQFRLPLPDDSFVTMPRAGVVGDTPSTTQNLDCYISIDDGANWNLVGTIDLSLPRKAVGPWGGFREAHIRLVHAGSGEVRLRRFYGNLNK